MKNWQNTIDAFKESFAGSKRIKQNIIDNIKFRIHHEFRMNLVYLIFNFNNNTVNIEYYVEDKNYPVAIISFDELTNIVNEN